jgi:hypothetical protein
MKIIAYHIHKTKGYQFSTFIKRDELLEHLGLNEKLKLRFVIDVFERKQNNWIAFDLGKSVDERKQRFSI